MTGRRACGAGLVICLAAAWSLAQEGGDEPAPAAPKRGWGPEQATGEPDTPRAGDIRTAWASLRPDGGPEWLRVGYRRAARIAQVRIRETFNPGAVVKVSALADGGREVLLWEGRDPTAEAPGDLVVEVPEAKRVEAKSVKIYLDTRLVPGWNEIDAVELIGRDGTRQWAATAAASSTFAEHPHAPMPMPRPPLPPRGREPLHELVNRPVTVRLEGGKTLAGTFVRSAADFIAIRQRDARKLVFVNKAKIVAIETAEPADF